MLMLHGNFTIGIAHCRDDSYGVGVPPALKRLMWDGQDIPPTFESFFIPLLGNAPSEQ